MAFPQNRANERKLSCPLGILFKPNSGSFSILLLRVGCILNEQWCAEVEELEAFNLENGLM